MRRIVIIAIVSLAVVLVASVVVLPRVIAPREKPVSTITALFPIEGDLIALKVGKSGDLYVMVRGAADVPNSLVVLDGGTGTKKSSIALPHERTLNLFVNADETFAYTFISTEKVGFGTGVAMIDLKQGTVVSTREFGEDIGWASFDDKRNQLIIATMTSSSTSTIRVIDANTLEETQPIDTPIAKQTPRPSLYMDSVNDRLYLVGEKRDTVSVVDLNTRAQTHTWEIPVPAHRIALDPTTDTMYVVSHSSLMALDSLKGVSTMTIPIREPLGASYSMVFDSKAHYLYLSGGDSTLLRFDTKFKRFKKKVELPADTTISFIDQNDPDHLYMVASRQGIDIIVVLSR